MALSRRGSVKSADAVIWPGFVDAMTALLMVLMFVLTIFMLVQSVLRETITSQDNELDQLTAQVAGLADALGLERLRADGLQADIGRLRSDLTAATEKGTAQEALIASLTGQLTAREGELTAAQTRITGFEAQVASLLAERDSARGEVAALTASVADLEAAQARLLSEAEAAQLALAQARAETDAQAEAARLAAARREALEGLLADLRSRNEVAATEAATAQAALGEAEAARLADAAALEALRAKLQGADAELLAMTLALEEQRKRAEETLTLLAAAETEAARRAAEAAEATETVTGRDALLATAQKALSEEQDRSAEAARRVALLNEQIAQLTAQLGTLQGLLDAAAERDGDAKVQLEALGSQLNSALAQVAAEQKRRAELEEAERKRLEAEKQDLERFRSEFFGQLRQVLAGREGVRIVGDRFVFSSEVLFNPGSADLAPEGRTQIAGVAATLAEIADQIPDGIDWVIRVDGHTDNVPLSGQGAFADNWELSQARALSVVRYMQDDLGFPPNRMAATGFGEYQPVVEGDSVDARAQNRRIELKLTER